jgi:hypothetical protein
MSSGTANHEPAGDREIAFLAEPRQQPPNALQFSLSTLLLIMTLVGVGAGLVLAVPPLGGWFIIIGSLALVRTLVECRRFLKDGRPLLVADKLRSYGGSLGYSFLAVVSAMIAFGVLSMCAMGVAMAVGSIAEYLIGGRGGLIVASIIGFIAIIGAVAVTAISFISVYWKTIEPRLTLDPPASSTTNSAR